MSYRIVTLLTLCLAAWGCGLSPSSTSDTAGPTVKVTDDSFTEAVLASDKPVLVDFWAPWCGPCRMMEPALNELATQYEGKVTIAKLNIDENPQTTSELGISSIPAMFLFHEGKIVKSFIGVQSKDTLETAFDELSSTWTDSPDSGESDGGQDPASAPEVKGPGTDSPPN